MKTLTEQRAALVKYIGYTCDPETGKIYNTRGKEVLTQNFQGNIILLFNLPLHVCHTFYQTTILNNFNPRFKLKGHQFVYYWVHGFIPKAIEHIDKNKTNNSIHNLKERKKNKE